MPDTIEEFYAENDTTGLATEQAALPITYATIDRLMARVRELELKLTAAGILEEWRWEI